MRNRKNMRGAQQHDEVGRRLQALQHASRRCRPSAGTGRSAGAIHARPAAPASQQHEDRHPQRQIAARRSARARAEFSCAIASSSAQTLASPAPGKRSQMRRCSARCVSMTLRGRARGTICRIAASGHAALVAQQLVDAGLGARLLVHGLDDHGAVEARARLVVRERLARQRARTPPPNRAAPCRCGSCRWRGRRSWSRRR